VPVADVVIVGGGPAGLNAALLLARARRDVVLADAGAGRNRFAGHAHNLLTRDGVPPGELRKIARQDLQPYPTARVVDDTVTAITGQQGNFTVSFAGGTTETARRILLATGVTDELPAIDGLQELWGRSVLNCPYCHGFEVRDRPLAVLLTHPLSVVQAVRLKATFSDDVIAHTGGTFGLDDGQRAMLAAREVPVHDQAIERIEGDGDGLRLLLAGGPALDRAALFVHPVTRQATPLARDLGCSILADDAVEINDMHQTTVAGVFAAGDLAHRPSMPFAREQVGIAAAAGLTAAIIIDQELTFTA
jgi:thioredoxin reductase